MSIAISVKHVVADTSLKAYTLWIWDQYLYPEILGLISADLFEICDNVGHAISPINKPNELSLELLSNLGLGSLGNFIFPINQKLLVGQLIELVRSSFIQRKQRINELMVSLSSFSIWYASEKWNGLYLKEHWQVSISS